ncbi:hypothetical protein B0H15DRAFT_279689 [Mycena belliarum]|uniref:Calcineurin-like phosphoesterase domain-containing protein n=1 Tax=Mycena belliarum TaxID=1033014 RepID=A0AAD6U425_9AGAR|nr:hypothetical protein B0H15DRAFT_279689 [Mycena belliae]
MSPGVRGTCATSNTNSKSVRADASGRSTAPLKVRISEHASVRLATMRPTPKPSCRPSPTDILLTHGPPHGVLDRTTKATLAGCPALAARLAALRPRLHVFGHIHEARGAYVHLWERAARPSAQNAAQVVVVDLLE